MSIRAHRVKKIIYAENTLFNSGHGNLSDFLLSHADTNDQRNNDGGGIVEFPLSVLKEALNEELDKDEMKSLKEELALLEKEGKDDEDFIQYDLF